MDAETVEKARRIAPVISERMKVAILGDPENVETRSGAVSHGLVKRGLAEYRSVGGWKNRLVLTALGLAVRAILKGE